MNQSGEKSNAAQPVKRRRFGWLATGACLIALLAWLNWPQAEVASDVSSIQIDSTASHDASAASTVAAVEANESVASDPGNDMPLEAADGTAGPSRSLEQLISGPLIEQAEHPLDPVLAVAKWSLDKIDRDIQDYACLITSQVFIDGRLDKERRMEAKIRHAVEGTVAKAEGDVRNSAPEVAVGPAPVPFGVYLKFMAPRHVKGQEVIWVDGLNDGKLVGHAGSGLLRMKRVYLSPDGPIAMRGSRYPIWDIGFKNLIGKMHEIGCCDREHDDCRVEVTPDVRVESRPCTLIEIFHDQKRACFQFHHAKIYVDHQYEIPIGYESYGWPEQPGDQPPLIEKFYYTNITLNVGLDAIDFSPNNPAYEYPSW